MRCVLSGRGSHRPERREVRGVESHLRAPRWLAGCWRVKSETPKGMVLADDTPYPCRVNEGVVAGISRAFSRQKPSYRILDPHQAKRAGGMVTRYEITFAPA